ncbi:MAG: hypothetical protein PHF86_03555 [Candidatus Nanoarchaeia archaeon]|nr:hypothetical protein [Candidatus Nanoarchaeia archaeon]
MKLKIPTTIFGEPIEGAMERRFPKDNSNTIIDPVVPDINRLPMEVNSNINLSDYVQLDMFGLYGKQVIISKFEIPKANNKNYEDTHRFVLDQGLYIPTPVIFINFLSKVIEAYNKKIELFDGQGNKIQEKEINDMYLHLTKDHISSYNVKGKEGAWTWLNARFIKGQFNDLDLETVIGINNNQLQTKKESLSRYLNETCYVDLNPHFNHQGLPKQEAKSSNQEYKQGKNVYFWKPIKDRVAGFNAFSGGADLYCNWNPHGTDVALGVYTCAEGA